MLAYPRRGRALLCDDMGLGKTVTALQCAAELGGALLVICPAGLQAQWRDHCAAWLPESHARLIISYDRCKTTAVDPQKYGVVIADECHYLKEHTSARAKAVIPIVMQVRRALLLSGTPAPNKPAELWPLLVALRPHDVPNYETFARRYCGGRKTRWGFEARGATHTEELNYFLNALFMIKRTKAQLGLRLPPVHTQELTVRLPDANMLQIASIEEKLQDTAARADKMRLVTQLFRATAEAKTAVAAEHMLALATHEAPIVVFAHHRCMIERLERSAEEHGWRVGTIHGGTPQTQRHRVAHALQHHKIDVAVLSLVAASAGYNLTTAHVVFFAELYWVPAIVLQAQNRVHRIGQTREVQVVTLVAADTCDARVLKAIRGKTTVLNRVVY